MRKLLVFVIIMEQRLLEDCSLLRQYKNLEYTIYKHKYTLKSDGHIVEKSIGAPQKEIVEVMSLVKQFSFEQFLCYFKKSDTTNIDYTLFRPSENRKELPFESCLSLIPDTLDNNCWQFVADVKFDRLGCFAYSAEEGTPAAGFDGQVDEEEKLRRAEVITEQQMFISDELNNSLVGSTVEVVVEGFDRYAECCFGRTAADAPEIDGKVFFTSDRKLTAGDFIKVHVDDLLDCDLLGTAVFDD